ncbi:hypothetical protein OOU_Y34scaffold00927g27 [Pyricularia oryzae Y34]|uniref:Uncharacterized protein n=2 Tax=Pyricularia oryzae TaxID=318829 RepID=A0AA97NNR3_PYRO3|nr:hypothetical protein OOU_Y34scaffold00927g27 [Pyricularia oryzae Y34]
MDAQIHAFFQRIVWSGNYGKLCVEALVRELGSGHAGSHVRQS